MKLTSNSFNDGQRIPDEFAFATIAATDHIALSRNKNPHLAWDAVPEGTESFVIVCHDPDVPTRPDDVNKEGRIVPADLPRASFFHWIVDGIPADVREIAAGTHASEVQPRGKSASSAPGGLRWGLNDYTAWFSGDADMEGEYYGYDGPCPPWNDAIVHHYVFTVYALGAAHLAVEGKLDGRTALEALARAPVLGVASLTGLYSLNPDLAASCRPLTHCL
ncbi:MAG: YbhB/YbcL family Raf kinase inhibitor-like protein [Parvibaculaceae bacterium]|nr:YbhB/YbcL family Raf kinase inhibitor-like protein [Parvibaculaceae bacterium]